MTHQPAETAADLLVTEARRAVHESLTFLAAPEVDRVRALIADLETAVEGRTAIRAAARQATVEPQDHPAVELYVRLRKAGEDHDTAQELIYAHARMAVRQHTALNGTPAVGQPAAPADLTPHEARQRAEQQLDGALRIVVDYVIESNDVGGLDCNDLADRLRSAGYELPDDEDES